MDEDETELSLPHFDYLDMKHFKLPMLELNELQTFKVLIKQL